MIVVLLLITLFTFIAYIFYKASQDHARYFRDRNLKYTSAFHTLRFLVKVFSGRHDFLEVSDRLYNAFPDEPMYGSFDLAVRQYIIRDPEVYKRLAIKDFEYFEDHRNFVDEEVEHLWGNALFLMHGEKWRQMRATLSPAFTGSKMRSMFGLVSDCANDVVTHFMRKSENGDAINIEMKDFFSRYANDVIASCAFGVKVNSFEEPNNDFYAKGTEFVKFWSFSKIIKMLTTMMAPKIARLFKLRIFDETVSNSFKNIVLDTMAMRKSNNIVRPDMINIMMQVRDGSLNHQTEDSSSEVTEGFATVQESAVGKETVTRKWNDDEIVAQCFVFYFGGFDTVSTALTFAAYEIAVNPDVQSKLYEEIVETNERFDGERISYDSLQKMKYLDQVICETLRKWPSGVPTDRICIKDYVYDDGNLKFMIEKGANVVFSNVGMHRDPKYFPNPEKFDPQRFNDENKQKIIPSTFTPFGNGPRNCIGSRFALMALKAILYNLLLHFSIEVNKETQIPLKLKKGGSLLTERGVHLELKSRKI